MNDHAEIIRRNSRPMEPVATGVEPRLQILPNIKAVLFDVYGTLLISGSGDVGVAMQMTRADALHEAIDACGVRCEISAEALQTQFYDAIQDEHQRAKGSGTQYPEIVVEETWRKVFDEGNSSGIITTPGDFDAARFALEFETRVNPVWPMPGFAEVVQTLRRRGLTLGIVSNAQFFTPLFVEHFLQGSLQENGFPPENCFYSYQHRVAKPGVELYQRAAEALDCVGIAACDILYVGNDMLNDVFPAASVGMKTALFAGDQRSLRLRKNDPRISTLQPDLTLTELSDLLTCLPR